MSTIPIQSLMMARSDCRRLRISAGQTLWVGLDGGQTRCAAACQRRAVPCQGWDTIRHPTPKCNGLVHSDEQRYVEGSLGTSNSSPI